MTFILADNLWLMVAAILPVAVAVALIFTRRMWLEIQKEQKRIDRKNNTNGSPSPNAAAPAPSTPQDAAAPQAQPAGTPGHPVWGQAPGQATPGQFQQTAAAPTPAAAEDPFGSEWDDDEPTVMFEDEEEVYEEEEEAFIPQQGGGMTLADALAMDEDEEYTDQSDNSATALEALSLGEDNFVDEDDEEEEYEEEAPHPAANPATAFNGHNAGMIAPQQFGTLETYIVKGVSVATTQDIQITVMAVNEEHAKQLADQQNIWVQHIVPAPKPDQPLQTQDPTKAQDKPTNSNVPPIVKPQDSTADWNPWDD